MTKITKYLLALFTVYLWFSISNCHVSLKHERATNYTIDLLRLAKATHIKAYMKTSQEPCNNFYNFACGNWHRLHPARLHNRKTSYLDQLQELYIRKSSEMLKHSIISDNNSSDRNLKNFFNSCRKQANNIQSDIAVLFNIVDFRGGWPEIQVPSWYHYEYDWLLVIATLKRQLGIDILIGLDIIPDYKEKHIHRLKIGAPLLPLGNQLYYLKPHNIYKRELYKQGIQKKLRSYFPGQSDIWLAEVSAQILSIEQELAKGLPHNMDLTLKQTTRLRTAADLKVAYGNYVDVNRYLNLIFNDTIYVDIYETPEDYLSNLVNVIKITPKLQLANYTIWRVIDFFDSIRVPQNDHPDIWCVQKVHEYFPQHLESLFHRNYNNIQIIKEIQNTWTDIKQVFLDTLKSSDQFHWMTSETRQRAINKLESLVLRFRGYDDRHLTRLMNGLNLESSQFYLNLVNILQWRTQKQLHKLITPPDLEDILYNQPNYEPTNNSIQIPIIFMQSRLLWDNAYPSALRYGTLGVLLARQMLHGFDNIGRRYDSHGYQQNWWDLATEQSYNQFIQCFREQYTKNDQFNEMLRQDSQLLSRIVSENEALIIANRAYQKWLKSFPDNIEKYQHEMLPLLHNSNTQLFYLGYAQLSCTDYPNNQNLFGKLPEEFKLNAVLSNSKDFVNVYSCDKDSELDFNFNCTIF